MTGISGSRGNGWSLRPRPRGWKASATAALVAALVVPLVAAGPAWGQGARATALEKRIRLLEKELKSMKEEMRSLANSGQEGGAGAAGDSAGVEVTTKGGLKVRTRDGRFSAKLGGRIMVDGAVYDEDRSNLGDGTEVRRGRLFLKGTLFRDWHYKSQFDFAGNKVAVKDLYMEYKGFAPASFKIGNFKEPFSLEEQTSSKYITFMERALPIAFSPGRHLGFGVGAHGANWTAKAGVFGSTVTGDAGSEGDEGWDLGGRLTFAPLHEKTRAVHLGIGVNYRRPSNESTRFRERPESHVTGVRFVDTGTLGGVDGIVRVGPELAAVYGPASIQAEYTRAMVARSGGFGDVDFGGWYVQASYFLTGESRAYSASKGVFGRVHPKSSAFDGGLGAWEVALRYSALDLTDGAVLGGQERNWTLGLNWYLNPHIRFMFNYVRINTDHDATGNAANLLPGQTEAGDDDPGAFMFRAQLDF